MCSQEPGGGKGGGLQRRRVLWSRKCHSLAWPSARERPTAPVRKWPLWNISSAEYIVLSYVESGLVRRIRALSSYPGWRSVFATGCAQRTSGDGTTSSPFSSDLRLAPATRSYSATSGARFLAPGAQGQHRKRFGYRAIELSSWLLVLGFGLVRRICLPTHMGGGFLHITPIPTSPIHFSVSCCVFENPRVFRQPSERLDLDLPRCCRVAHLIASGIPRPLDSCES